MAEFASVSARIAALSSIRDAKAWRLRTGLAAAAIVFACAACSIFALISSTDFPVRTLAAVFAILSAGALLLAGLIQAHELLGQRIRDLEAQEVLDAVRAGADPAGPFTLYLRPFASTDAVAADDVRLAPFRTAAGVSFVSSRHRFELEDEVAKAARRIGPMVALGKPLEHVGAGRILVAESEWKDAISRLMDAAALIVLLPSSRDGTAFEIERILSSGLLRKTIVLDPPNGSCRDLDRFDHAAEWERIRTAFARWGVRLPADDRRGRAYCFAGEPTPSLSRRLSVDGAGLDRFLIKAFRTARAEQTEGTPP